MEVIIDHTYVRKPHVVKKTHRTGLGEGSGPRVGVVLGFLDNLLFSESGAD